MKKMSEWWESEGGFFGKKYIEGDNSIDGYIPNKKESLIERTKREVKGIIKLSKLNKGKVLDIPCGYGRHSIELDKKGFEVTGVDINEEHLKKARKMANNKISFFKKDMRDIGKENYNKFNLIINMFYSFGFFEAEKDNEKTMKEFYKSLKIGGKLILHTDVSPEIIEGGGYKLREERNLEDNKKLLIEERYNNKTKRIEGSWTIDSKDKKEKLTPYSVRIYSKEEFERLARQAGFKKVNFYGSFNSEKFTKDSPELIMVAVK